MIPVLTSEPLSRSAGSLHGFFTRQGGASEGQYSSLNCGLGSRDDPQRVAENRRRAMDQLGLHQNALATAYQVHSSRVVVVERPGPVDQRPQADALVTRVEGIALGILTADCAPVLMCDAKAGVIGAAHAGWRGARGGVLEATIAAMLGLGASLRHTAAAIGPCIQRASYEVGPEFRDAFASEGPATEGLFEDSGRSGYFRFDLSGYVAKRLADAGIAEVDALPHDTCADDERFFSYRRTTLDGGGDYGRLLSAITLAR